MNDDKEWTKEDIANLTKLWSDPRNSLSAIGKALTRSKNSVAGKAHRLNLQPRPSPIKRDGDRCAQPRVFKSRRVTGATLPVLASLDAPVPVDPQPTTIAPQPATPAPALPSAGWSGRVRDCCWPIGEPGTKAFRFCGEDSLPGRNYCPKHHAIGTISPRALLRESATLAEVEAYAAKHRVFVKKASGMLGLLVAVNNHRRAAGDLPFTLSKHGAASLPSDASHAESSTP